MLHATPASPASPASRRNDSPSRKDFLTQAARMGPGSPGPEDSPVKVLVHRVQPGDPHIARQLDSLRRALQTRPAGPAAAPALVVVEVAPQQPPRDVPSAPASRRTVTHLVPPWHRTQRPPGHGIAGNVALGLGLAGMTAGLLCTRVLACEDDANIASGGAALGALAGVMGAGALELMGARPLERPMVHLHRALRHLWSALWRPSIAEQLRALVRDARDSELNIDGLDAVLARCEAAMAGYSPEQRAREGWLDIVGALVPDATGHYSGPKADLVRNRVMTMAPAAGALRA